MITADKITVGVGDKVWRVVDDQIAEGVLISIIYEGDWIWMEAKWPDDSVGYWLNSFIFGSEANAINALIYRTMKNVEQGQSLISSLEARLKELK